MSLFSKFLVAAFMLAGAACSSPEYRYFPSGGQAGVERFEGEASFSNPIKDSSGNVRVTSLGIADLKPKEDGKSVPALHLRLVLSNQGPRDWNLHIPDQTVAFPNHAAPSTPIYANSDSLLTADIVIPAKSLRTIDLFYELPSGWQQAQDLPEFDFHWRVRQGPETGERSVSFARQEIPEYVASSAYPYPYGPYVGLSWGSWWWGPSSGPYVNYRR